MKRGRRNPSDRFRLSEHANETADKSVYEVLSPVGSGGMGPLQAIYLHVRTRKVGTMFDDGNTSHAA
jgi:hypothetical protein